MESRNPVLTREFGQAALSQNASRSVPTPDAGTLQAMYDRPRPMTLDDVVVKSGILFAILVVGAVAGWNLIAQAPALVWVTMFVALGLGLFISFRRTTSPGLIMAYAAVEGVFLGGISSWFLTWTRANNPTAPNIVLQAVIGTFAAFAVMLLLYRSGRLRATPRFQKMMMIALLSYLGIALVSLVGALFGLGGGWGFYGIGGVGILLCVAGVALAAFTLVLDFDAIEKGVAAGVPEQEAWRASFGLMVTLVWLYLELLRLLAIVQGR